MLFRSEIVPRLIKMGYLEEGLEFKYSNRLEMSNKDKIDLYRFITERYEVSADEIEKEFAVTVGKQLNVIEQNPDDPQNPNGNGKGKLGKVRSSVNFLRGEG